MLQEEKLLYSDLYTQKLTAHASTHETACQTHETASTCSILTSVTCFVCWILINCLFNLW